MCDLTHDDMAKDRHLCSIRNTS